MFLRNKKMISFISLQMLLSFLFISFITSPIFASPPKRNYWPTVNWKNSYPEAQGMDSEKLLKVIPFIINNLPDIQSLLVVRKGYVVFENYYGMGMPGRSNTVHSVTKSITSALVGIAKDRGLIGDLNQSLPKFFPKYFDIKINPKKKSINLKHLLTMTAGLQPVKVKDWSLLMQWNFAPDRAKFTLDLPLIQAPGEKFAYSNPISHLLSVILENKTCLSLSKFADQNLFRPLGITPRLWKTDAQGHTNGHGGLYLSSRDMAKIGFLYLNNGFWDGKQIISAEWIEESTRRQVPAGPNYAYGYQWWIKNVAGCSSYRAWGRNGQFIVIVPKLDLVISVTSRTGLPGNPSGYYSPLFDIVADAVIDKSCRKISQKELAVFGESTLPGDLQDFFYGFSQTVESKNIASIMNYYSNNFLDSGRDKQSTTRFYRLFTRSINKFKVIVDQCIIKGDTAKISGSIETNLGPSSLSVWELIKEDGSWKWYGNQRAN